MGRVVTSTIYPCIMHAVSKTYDVIILLDLEHDAGRRGVYSLHYQEIRLSHTWDIISVEFVRVVQQYSS